MVAKLCVLVLTLTAGLLMTPALAPAQEASGGQQDLSSANRQATSQPLGPDSGDVLAALQPSANEAALRLARSAFDQPVYANGGLIKESVPPDNEGVPIAPVSAAKGSGSGLGFMIGGAGALVGGLLIGGTGGALIAAGGVALGVYGAIIYF